MNRYIVKFEIDQSDLETKRQGDDAFVSAGEMFVFADQITDAAWHVKFMLHSEVEIKSVARG